MFREERSESLPGAAGQDFSGGVIAVHPQPRGPPELILGVGEEPLPGGDGHERHGGAAVRAEEAGLGAASVETLRDLTSAARTSLVGTTASAMPSGSQEPRGSPEVVRFSDRPVLP